MSLPAALGALGLPLLRAEPFVVCPSCGMGLAAGHDLLEKYFDGDQLRCGQCANDTSAWSAAIATINHPVPFLHDSISSLIGFKSVFFQIALAPSQTTVLKLAEHGVPVGSRLIRRNYTPMGTSVMPVELHGNDVLVRRRQDEIVLYGRPFDPASPAGTNELNSPAQISVNITYAEPRQPDEYALDALGRAFSALMLNELEDMVIPATVGVELTCKRLLTDFSAVIGTSGAGVKDKDLLTQVVPLIASAVGVAPLEAEVCHKISRLWGQRDLMAHKGHLHAPYLRENAGAQLVAAIFAFRYLTLLRDRGVRKGII